MVGLVAATVALGLTYVASLTIGTENVSLPTVWQAVTDYRDIGDQWIVHDLRIQRTALALVVGVALGLSGTLIQAVGRNNHSQSPRSSGSTPARHFSLSPQSPCSA